MNMDFGGNKTPIEVIKEEHLEGLILEIFILMLIIDCIKSHGKNLMSQRILIRIIIAQIIKMLINVKLNVDVRVKRIA